MNSAVTSSATDKAQENRKKRKHIEVETAPKSELPYRLLKKRTGQVLGSFKTQDELETFLDGYPLAQLESKPTRRRSSR